jgi:hypothetical protein
MVAVTVAVTVAVEVSVAGGTTVAVRVELLEGVAVGLGVLEGGTVVGLAIRGVGVGVPLQGVQRSITVLSPLKPLRTWKPTAHTSPVFPAATPHRKSYPDPGLGLGTTVQTLPSQCSTSVCAFWPKK